MSFDTKSSGSVSGRTSSSAPASDKSDKRSKDYDPAFDATVPDVDLDVDQYLRRQGERAKAAIMGTADALGDTARRGVWGIAPGLASKLAGGGEGGVSGSGTGEGGPAGAGNADSGPMKAVRNHPWYVVGAATAVGFLGAVYFDPTRFGSLKRKLNKLEKRLKKQEQKAPPPPPQPASKEATAAKASIFGSLGTLLVSEAVKQVKPFVANVIEPIMSGQAHAGGPQDMTPEMAAALRERFGGQMPPRGSADPQI